MLKTSSATVRPLPLQIVNRERIPVERYYDEEFFRLENEHLWPHVWQMACRLELIPNVGDWVEYSNLGRSVIIVRTSAGVKAFHNVCRHRGVQLAQASHGNCRGSGFICPFHGWRWNIDGENTFVYGRHLFSEQQLEQTDLALKPCRIDLWGGCAFVNFDDDAPGLRESFGPLADRLDQYQTDKLRAEWWYATELPANWKVAAEAFMEGYHVMRTHPQLQKASPDLLHAMYGRDAGGDQSIGRRTPVRESILAHFRHMEELSEGMAGMCHAKDVETARGLLNIDLPDDPAQAVKIWYDTLKSAVTSQGRERGEPTPDLKTLALTHPIKPVEFLFPHYFLLPFLSSMSSYRIRPLGTEKCLFEMWSLTLFPEGQEPEPPMEPVMLPYDSERFPPIPRQDYSNIPAQQVGLHGGGFEFMRLSKDIEGLIGNYQQLIDGYLKGAPPAELAKGTRELAGNFDGPIRNLGF
jgi:carnitine monooxygenase subunit